MVAQPPRNGCQPDEVVVVQVEPIRRGRGDRCRQRFGAGTKAVDKYVTTNHQARHSVSRPPADAIWPAPASVSRTGTSCVPKLGHRRIAHSTWPAPV